MMKKLRTIVYIDAFNLYYGVLKKTPYKWLDIDSMVKKILKKNEIVSLKYFTAPVKGDKKNPNRLKHQKNYISALKTHLPNFECIQGYFIEKKVKAKNLNPPPSQVTVALREEKGTDVNIAVEIVKDSYTQDFDCVLLISNDGDLARALSIAKETGKKVVVIVPRIKNSGNFTAQSYKKFTDNIFPFIDEKILKNSILPKTIGQFTCPTHWILMSKNKKTTPHDVVDLTL
jgi:uncharacterized LabA/DUF88 family protein